MCNKKVSKVIFDFMMTSIIFNTIGKTLLSSQVKLSFIVIPLHVGTYSGTKRRASQDYKVIKQWYYHIIIKANIWVL